MATIFSSSRTERGLSNSASPKEVIGKGVRFVKRIYVLRVIGLSIGFTASSRCRTCHHCLPADAGLVSAGTGKIDL